VNVEGALDRMAALIADAIVRAENEEEEAA
jgi:hypothetical protein